MHDTAGQRAPQGDGALEGGDREAGVDAATDGVAHDAPRPCVEDDGHIDEAGCDGDEGDVADPQLIGRKGFEASGDQRIDRSVMVAVGGFGETPPASRIEIVQLHQPPDLLAVHEPTPVAQLGADAAIAVAFPGVGDRPHLRDERRIGLRRRGRGVVARPCDAHQVAPPLDGDAAGPAITDVGALVGEGPQKTPPLTKASSSACLPTSRSSAAMRAS